MFGKNPVTAIVLEHLRQQKPRYRWFRTIFLLSAFFFIAPLVHKFNRSDGLVIIPMMLLGLFLYWRVQANTLILAQKVADYDWKLDAPNEILGTTSNSQVLWGNLWAVLRYQLPIYVILAFGLLGLSLAEVGWISRLPIIVNLGNYWESTLAPIDLIRYFSPLVYNDYSLTSHLPHPVILLFAYLLILILCVSSAAVFTVIRFALREKAQKLAIIITCGVLIGWLAVHELRNIMTSIGIEPSYYCGEVGNCADMARDRFLIRVIESTEVSVASFIDGGTLGNMQIVHTTTMDNSYISYNLHWHLVSMRHILAMGLSAFLQWAFVIVLMRRTIQGSAKKKK